MQRSDADVHKISDVPAAPDAAAKNACREKLIRAAVPARVGLTDGLRLSMCRPLATAMPAVGTLIDSVQVVDQAFCSGAQSH